jgi:hypothetical protein
VYGSIYVLANKFIFKSIPIQSHPMTMFFGKTKVIQNEEKTKQINNNNNNNIINLKQPKLQYATSIKIKIVGYIALVLP